MIIIFSKYVFHLLFTLKDYPQIFWWINCDHFCFFLQLSFFLPRYYCLTELYRRYLYRKIEQFYVFIHICIILFRLLQHPSFIYFHKLCHFIHLSEFVMRKKKRNGYEHYVYSSCPIDTVWILMDEWGIMSYERYGPQLKVRLLEYDNMRHQIYKRTLTFPFTRGLVKRVVFWGM